MTSFSNPSGSIPPGLRSGERVAPTQSPMSPRPVDAAAAMNAGGVIVPDMHTFAVRPSGLQDIVMGVSITEKDKEKAREACLKAWQDQIGAASKALTECYLEAERVGGAEHEVSAAKNNCKKKYQQTLRNADAAYLANKEQYPVKEDQ